MDACSDYLDPDAAAGLIGCSDTELRIRRCRGERPAFLKVGLRVYYERHEIESWLESCRRASTSAAGPPTP